MMEIVPHSENRERSVITEYDQINGFSYNMEQELIITDDARIYRAIDKHWRKLKTKNAWRTSLGVFLALFPFCFKIDFQDFLYIPNLAWKVIFITLVISSAIWLIVTIIQSRNPPTTEDIIKEIKDSAHERPTFSSNVTYTRTESMTVQDN